MVGKGDYLKRITSGTTKWRTLEIGEKLDGSSPPSIFIGSYGYPKVYAGPMIAPYHGSAILDQPEQWIPNNKTQEDIIGFRLDLVRGKQLVSIKELDNKLVQKLREISLSENSVESEAQFKSIPRGMSFSEDHSPFGPSAGIEKFEIGNFKFEQHLEKAYYDTDLKAGDGIWDLYTDGVSFSQIQKALSSGTLGIGKERKLVPTRWSITAADSTLANRLYRGVIYYDILENYEVYEFSSLNNYYAVILLPTPWQYEWIEAFIHILGKEEMIFADHECVVGKHNPKKEYSSVGGCYYSCKFAVLEALWKMKKQAGALVLREAYEGYVPLGVFNVRENVRNALKQKPKEFDSFRGALTYLSSKLRLPVSRFMQQGVLMPEMVYHTQTTL